MTRNGALTKRAREVIKEKLKNNPKMSTEELIEEIRPHYMVDVPRLVDKDLRKQANGIIARMRDENGVRDVFAVKDHGASCYVAVDQSVSESDLRLIHESLTKTRIGIDASIKKVSRRRQVVAGQLELEFKAEAR